MDCCSFMIFGILNLQYVINTIYIHKLYILSSFLQHKPEKKTLNILKLSTSNIDLKKRFFEIKGS